MGFESRTASLLVLIGAVSVTSGADPAWTVDLDGGTKLEMILVKKGNFQQGSPATEVGRKDDETSRAVTISRDFYLSKFPVTRGQFARFVQDIGYRSEAETGPSGGFGFDGAKLVQRKEFTWRNPGFKQTDDHPVALVAYGDAQAFVAWLSKHKGSQFSLPTEAQWEYACRAGSTTRYYNGETDAGAKDIAWFKDNAGDGTRPVGQKKPNAWGLYDMSGNVYQWCRDWYGPYPAGPVTDPEETRADLTKLPRRVLRGGSWLVDAAHCRSAARNRNTAGSRNADNGFRVVAWAQPAVDQKPVRSTLRVDDLKPVSDRSGPPTPASGGFADSPFGILCPLLAVSGFVVLVIVLLRKGSQAQGYDRRPPRPPGTPPRPMPSRYNTRPAPDGFWLDAPSLPLGSVVHYRYRSSAGWQTGTHTVRHGAGGHFIYTGAQPADIEVVNVVPPVESTGGSWEEPPAERAASEPPSSTQSSSESFSGFPSAY
jgi:formylglycine-generating enzyme required for sulfatase activity